MNIRARSRELTKLINGMEAMGYQIDFIKVFSEGAAGTDLDRRPVIIKASPLPDDTVQRGPAGSRRNRILKAPLDSPI